MFKQFSCIQVAITRCPRSGEVSTVGQGAEVSYEPSPVSSDRQRKAGRDNNTKYGPTPQGHQRLWIRLEEAVWEMPWKKICVRQSSAAYEATDNVAGFMNERHHTPSC